jgi:hypothetical protein
MYRLALPVFPLILVALLWGIAQVLRTRLAPALAIRGACYAAIIPLAFCVPALFYIAQRANAGATDKTQGVQDIMEYYRIPFRPEAEAQAARQLRAFADMDRIRASTREGERVMAHGPAVRGTHGRAPRRGARSGSRCRRTSRRRCAAGARITSTSPRSIRATARIASATRSRPRPTSPG